MPTALERRRSKYRREHGLAWCSSCKCDRPQRDFEPSLGRRPFGLSSHCRPCDARRKRRSAKDSYWRLSDKERYLFNRKNNLKKFFGLSLSDYEELLSAQSGLCAICGGEETVKHHSTGVVPPLVVDHDRDTGQVRGLLCTKCNKGIGLLLHDPSRLRSAAVYLERSVKAAFKPTKRKA